MRKIHRKQILDILQSIRDAQEKRLFSECQEAALALCDFIDQIASTGTQTVSMLEQYCEMLYKANNGEIGEKALRKHLIKIENSLKHEFKPRFEIAFISYKASMSDSLESIYLAAMDDPGSDAYFIPVPYYNRNKDASFGDMVYEGTGFYDESINLTDWQSYDMEARRPDVIFTFNPYDGQNLWTSIHPDFYCERLVKFTDMLVYVPYFVTADDIPDYFTTQAGSVYAHKVIVQSEKIREKYIHVYKETFGSKYGKPEDKFIALGSPKFDKVLSTKREDCTLPAEWQKLMEGKKAILYNTTSGAMVSGGEQYLRKMLSVFNAFRNRDDAVLWWRPHPLCASAYKAALPELQDRYNRIVREFKRGQWGIFDDTPDLHRAIACTDAYYGDPSSLTSLYAEAKKPVLHSNVEVDDFYRVLHNLHWFCVVGEEIYISCLHSDYLLKLDKNSGMFGVVARYREENLNLDLDNSIRSYTQFTHSDGHFYFSPSRAADIVKYSISNRSSRLISVFSKRVEPAKPYFGIMKAVGDYVFFLPHSCHMAVRLNVKTDALTICDDWYHKLSALSCVQQGSIATFPVVVGDVLWFSSTRGHAVVSVDIQTCKSKVYAVGKHGYRYSAICHDGENFWLAPRDGATPVIKWHPDKGVIKKFPDVHAMGYDKVKVSFYTGIYSDGYFYLFPYYAKNAVKIDVNSSEVSLVDELSYDCAEVDGRNGQIVFGRALLFGDNTYLYKMRGKTQTLIEFNLKTRARRDIQIMVSADVDAPVSEHRQRLFLANLAAEQPAFIYDTVINLSSFIELISKIDVNGNPALPNKNTLSSAGERIYAYVKDLALSGGS